MSNIKKDLLKEIEEKVARKKILSKDISRTKTIAFWVSEFFVEAERLKTIKADFLIALALGKLTSRLQSIDKKCYAVYKQDDVMEANAQVEIFWSKRYIEANNCEPVLAMDASSAFFENTIEKIN